MNTYDPPTTLDAISHNAAVVIGIGGLSIIAMFVFFIEAARMGRRDRGFVANLCEFQSQNMVM